MTPSVQESVAIAATPQQVYDAVSDVVRMGQWSPEATGGRWLTPGPVGPGSRFRGTNRRGRVGWATRCDVVVADPGREFSFEVHVLVGPIARWSYTMRSEHGGARVTETWDDLRRGFHGQLMRLVGFAVTGVWRRAEHNRASMRTTLEHLRAHLEKQPSGPHGSPL